MYRYVNGKDRERQALLWPTGSPPLFDEWYDSQYEPRYVLRAKNKFISETSVLTSTLLIKSIIPLWRYRSGDTAVNTKIVSLFCGSILTVNRPSFPQCSDWLNALISLSGWLAIFMDISPSGSQTWVYLFGILSCDETAVDTRRSESLTC